VNDDKLGIDVTISGNGMYLAAGADDGDPNGLDSAGYARLYARSGTDWNMIQQINGTRSVMGNFGWSLDFSHDGTTLAIVDASVYMYELSNITFLYELVHTIDDLNGPKKVSVSGDGMVVGVTSSSFSSSSFGSRIFERIGDIFQQRGTDISDYGYESGIALNYDGTIAIVGDYSWPSLNYIGRAAVFQWRDDNEEESMQWMQLGSDITGDAAGNYVSITYNGLTVAVGADGYSRDGLTSRGLVRVYNYDSVSDTWKQSGIDLLGDKSKNGFSSTAISSGGTYLAVGTWGGNYVKLFSKNGDNYEAVGDTIIGEGGRFGSSIDISADGSALVAASIWFDSSRGKVYLYETFLSSSTLAPTSSSSLAPSLRESSIPTAFPTFLPSLVTFTPSKLPSLSPSKVLSVSPSKHASNPPTLSFSTYPSAFPSDKPSAAPVTKISSSPSVIPSSTPSIEPVGALSMTPSISPTATPSSNPSITSSISPSATPSSTPSITPSTSPSATPSSNPSITPSISPSATPSSNPSIKPSTSPSATPSSHTSATPSISPSATSSSSPSNATFETSSVIPSVNPSTTPIDMLSSSPSTSSMNEMSKAPSITRVESSRNIFMSTTGVSVRDVTSNSLTALGAVTSDFFTNVTDLTVTKVYVVVANHNADVADDGDRFLQTDDSVTFLFEIATLSLATTPVSSYLVGYLTTNIMDFTDLMRDSDPAFSGLVGLQVGSAPSSYPSLLPSLIPPTKPIVGVGSDKSSEPTTKSPTESPTVSHVPTISFMPTLKPTSSPTSNPTSFPTKMQSDVPSQMPSLTPDDVESILSIVFSGVPAKEMNEVEVEAFEATTFDFLVDNLGQTMPSVLVEEVTFLSQSLSQSSPGNESSSPDSEEEPVAAKLTVNVGVSGEYLPPPEINFDDVLVEVYDEEGQHDYLEFLLLSDNEYFNAATNLDIVDVRVVDSVQEDRSSGSVFGLLGDEGGYSIIGVGCAIVLLIAGMLVREKSFRRARTSQYNQILKLRHSEARRLQNEHFGVQDWDYAVEEEYIQYIGSNSEKVDNEN